MQVSIAAAAELRSAYVAAHSKIPRAVPLVFLGAGGVAAVGVLGARASGALGDGKQRDGATRLLGYGAAGVGGLAMLGAAIGQKRTVDPTAMRRLAQVAAVSTGVAAGAVTATSIPTGDIKRAHANTLVDLASIEAGMGVLSLIAWGAGGKAGLERSVSAAKVIARDKNVPRTLRTLAAATFVPFPGPVDEILGVSALAWLKLRHPKEMRSAWRSAQVMVDQEFAEKAATLSRSASEVAADKAERGTVWSRVRDAANVRKKLREFDESIPIVPERPRRARRG